MSRALILALATLLALDASTVVQAAEGESERISTIRNNLPMEPLTVSVFSNNRVRGLLAVDLSLDLKNPDKRAQIEKILPRLRDRYITSLTRFAANRVEVNRALDLAALTQLLQDVTDDVLGQQAANILIGGATVRRL
ncbi:flagellar basal body-associated FliL family protein [Govanella unica]|uniref:Uncharacterized protein n=1 Tax=Govanella unica TaxID=2975056 RepID=A0A9X3TWB7_9PROT|nr:hypothetical protein [Govania unica]MDA5192637.1 hypothetical protein [Govania unica]